MNDRSCWVVSRYAASVESLDTAGCELVYSELHHSIRQELMMRHTVYDNLL